MLLNESGIFYKINIIFCAELSAPNCPRRIVREPSPLLLRGALNTERILCRSFMPNRHRQLLVKDLQKSIRGGYRAGFEPTTLRTKGGESTNEPPHPTYSTTHMVY